MVVLNEREKIIFFMGRKRFGYRQADKEGMRSYAEAQEENPDAGFYRIRNYSGKVIRERLPFYRPTNPQTVAQQNWRSVFADGVSAYRLLSPTELGFWQGVGTRKKMTAYNAFLSYYLNTHKL